MDEPAQLGIAELSRTLAANEITSVELTQYCLRRIAEQDDLNAFVTVDPETACDEAAAADLARANDGSVHLLTGIPIALKDVIATANLRTTAGSKILAEWVPEADAPVVQRLRACGAVVLGKTNLHEFAYGGTSENEHTGPVRNPWDPRRIAGGSSGGSAAAVAAGFAPAAVGTDAAGSVRMPAGQCGIVGFKPTYGRAGTAGLIPLGWSVDHVGAMTRTVRDAEILQNALNGSPATAAIPAGPVSVAGLRVGVPAGYAFDGADAEVVAAVRAALDVLTSLGVTVTEVDVPELASTVETTYAIIAGEALAYHSQWWPERADDYGADVRRKLEAAATRPAGDYVLAHQERARIGEALAAVLGEVDALVTPTTLLPAKEIGARDVVLNGKRRPATGGGVFSRLTAPFNLSGGPAISVPCGLADGMPVGLQIASSPGRDELVLTLAAAYEDAVNQPFIPPGGSTIGSG